MPPEWLAVVEVRADADRQQQILAEAGAFWLEVLEARAALPKDQPRDWSKVEAEFA